MRIALVTTSWPSGPDDPCGHFVQTEARELEEAGHEVLVLAPSASRPESAFGWPGVAARLKERPLTRTADAVGWLARTRARVRGLAVDRIIAHWAVPCGWPIALAAKDGAAEIEAVSHGGDVRLLARMPSVLRERVAGAIAARAVRWRFVSEALRDALLGVLGRGCRDRVEQIAAVCAPSIELPDVRADGARLRRELGGVRVAVSVGRLVGSKNVAGAIEHVACSADVDELVVVGDGPERAKLERLAAARGVNARFVGLLPRPRALAWIAAADVLLQTSRAEGLSTVVREARALGTRVLELE